MALNVEFPYLYPHQEDVFNAVKEDNGRGRAYVVKAKRQCGKSILAITLLLYFAFKNEGSIGFCLDPTLHQGRLIYKNLISSLGGEDSPAIKSSNATLLEVEFINGSRILFRSAEQRQALRGATVKKSILVLDEASFIEDDIIDILLPIVDANKCPVLFLSTPLFESGRFYERYKEGLSKNDFTVSFNWGDYDLSAFLSPEKLEYYREILAPLKFKSEILGEFISEGSYIFGDFAACVRGGGELLGKPVYGGIDWSAGGGNDYTVLTLMTEDRMVTECFSYKDFDAVDLVDELAKIIISKGLKRVQVELNSIGSVFYDMLKAKLPGGILKGFNTTNESKRQIIEELIKGFQKRTLSIPPDKELKKELQHYTMEKTAKGYTYNGADGVNDDYVISLALAYDLCPKVDKPRGKFEVSFA